MLKSLGFMVLGCILLAGCTPSASDVEDMVDESISVSHSSFSFVCPTCSTECQRQEFEVVDVGEDERICELRALIKFYYSCDVCKRSNKPYSWSKTWCYTLRDKSESFWKSLQNDRMFPFRRYPKCVLFKLFSGDFFSQYKLAYSYDNLSLIEKCDNQDTRLVKRYSWLVWVVVALVFLIMEYRENPEKVREIANRFWLKAVPVIKKVRERGRELLPFCQEILEFCLSNCFKILWGFVGLLLVLQLIVKLWTYWNN